MALEKPKYNQLRKKAESRVAKTQDLLKGITLEKAKTLLHELEVHQIELEMQNEELRETQHRLEEVGDQYTDLFDFAPVGYLILDKKGVIVNINLTACNLLGIERALIKGKPLSAYMVSGESRTLFLKLQEAFKTGEVPSFELKIRHKSKALFTASLQGVVTNNKNQADSVCRIALQDISKLKEAETLVLHHEALQKEKEKIQQYIDVAPVVFILIDTEHNIQMANQKACNLLGYDNMKIIGRNLFDNFIHKTDKNTIEKSITAIENKKSLQQPNFEGHLQSKNGEQYVMNWTGVALFDKKDNLIGTLLAGEDISERKKTEQRKEEYTQDLEDIVEQRTQKLTEALHNEKMVNKMKTAFVSMASHEFRTPLTSVMSSAILMKKYNDLKQYDKQSRHIERIKSSVNQLTNILEDFLSLDKLNRGIVTTSIEVFNLKEFIKEILEEIEWSLKEKQQIHFQHKGNPMVVMDKKIVHNVILNLLTNAIKYSDTDIFVSTTVKDDDVQITIIDKGIGIPKKEQKQLFNKFFRAKNALNIQGTGLGLSIVRHYVNLLEGNITFESELGKGSTFYLSLPKMDLQQKKTIK